MKKWCLICCCLIYLLWACGTSGSLSRIPEQDKNLYEIITKLTKNPNDPAAKQSFESSYADAVLNHQQKITAFRNSEHADRWERIMNEYGFLTKIADAVKASKIAATLVKTQRYDEQYNEAKQKAADTYYDQANALLQNDDRSSAKEAYTLLQQTNKLIPGYKDTKRLLDIAAKKSVLNVVVNPVNYYAQTYGYWGLNNDYVQQEIMRDLRFQLGTGNVNILSEQEARSYRVIPDRVIDLNWNELFVPVPYTQTFTRELSKQIETGQTSDKKPIYTTVRATLYVTRKEVQAYGTLSCRVTDNNRQTLLSDNFPANYTWVQEYATYRGDSRALSSYEIALISNARIANYSRRDIFTQVFRQVYPQLISRIRSLDW